MRAEEALRYLGAGEGADDALRRQVTEAAGWLEARITPRWTWRLTGVRLQAEAVLLTDVDIRLPGGLARRMLATCRQAAVCCCTLGQEAENLLRMTQRRDMARAVILDACASALTEEGCERMQAEIASRLPGWYQTDRFSPGYGDLPLELQGEIARALDLSRRLGVHVTQSGLLIPQKTVTAFVGLARTPQPARIRGCGHCALRERCRLRGGRADRGQACL